MRRLVPLLGVALLASFLASAALARTDRGRVSAPEGLQATCSSQSGRNDALDSTPGLGRRTGFVAGEVIVKFRPSLAAGSLTDRRSRAFGVASQLASLAALHSKHGLIGMKRVFAARHGSRMSTLGAAALEDGFDRTYTLSFDKSADVRAIAREYARDPNVEYAHPNRLVHTTAVPNDPMFAQQWAHKVVNAAAAWDIQTGSPDAIIAIVDTGTDYNHQDLAANMWINEDEVPGNGIDDDNNGFVDDVRGWDFVGTDYNNPVEDNDPMDQNNHGTHTAGIAAAVADNGLGVAGMSRHSRIMPVKFLDADGVGDDVTGARAIRYAADNGARILSNSWGGQGESGVITDAVNYALAKGCVVVAAAGNDGGDLVMWPGGVEGLISVGATEQQSGSEMRASYSNFGRWVDVSAPGTSVQSTLRNDAYGAMTGTSMATPLVAGLCALVMAQHPDWSNKTIMGQVASTADGMALREPLYFGMGMLGTGRINAFSALTTSPGTKLAYVGYSVADPTGDNDSIPDPGETIELRLRIKNLSVPVSGAEITVDSESPFVEVVNGTISRGAMPTWDESLSVSPAILRIMPDCPADYALPVNVTIRSDGGFVKSDRFMVSMQESPWQHIGLDFSDASESPMLRRVAIDSQGRLYAAEGRSMFHYYTDNRDGLYRGTWNVSGGVDWVRFGEANGFPADYSAFDVAVHGDGTVAYAYMGTGNYLSGGEDCIYRTTDGGVSWTQVLDAGTGLNSWPQKLLVSPASPQVAYVLLDNKTSRNESITRTSDGGVTWQTVYDFGSGVQIADIVFDSENPSVMWACGYDLASDSSKRKARVYRSTDGGDSWTLVSVCPTAPSPVEAICARGDFVCAMLDNGVYRSLDGGATWAVCSDGLELMGSSQYGIACDSHEPGSVYLATDGSGMYKSVDSGGSWFALNLGDGPSTGYSIVQEALSPNRIIAGDLLGAGVSVCRSGRWEKSADGCLLVTPQVDMYCTGSSAGLFDPPAKSYTVSNGGLSEIAWAASSASTWLSVSPRTGTLAPGESARVTVTIDPSAAGFGPGEYADAIAFTNTTNGRGRATRAVSLTMPGPLYVRNQPLATIRDGKSWETALATIQEAVDAASFGQDVFVAKGTYTGSPVQTKIGVVLRGGYAGEGVVRDIGNYKSEIVGYIRGAEDVVIDGFTIRSPAKGVDCFGVHSMTITNNTIIGGSYGVYCMSESSPAIVGNTFIGCTSYGVYCMSTSAPTIANNVFERCSRAVYCSSYSSPEITSNTIDGSTQYGVYCMNGSDSTLRNNIITRCSTGVYADSLSEPVLSHNDLYGNAVNYQGVPAPPTDISQDPLFVNAAGGDYWLRAGSGCIDSGGLLEAPTVDRDGFSRPQDGDGDGIALCDMGAYERPPRITSAKKSSSDGSPITLGEVVVTATAPALYVEEPDRSSGIRIGTTGLVGFALGDVVNVSGTIRIDPASGECYVAPAASYPRVVPGCVGEIDSLLMGVRELGGGAFGAQCAVWEWRRVGLPSLPEFRPALGLNNIGLLVKVCGRVTEVDSTKGWFYLDDGSNRWDDTSTDGRCNIGVRVYCAGPLPSPAERLAVTGVSSCFKVEGEPQARRALLMRSSGDMQHL